MQLSSTLQSCIITVVEIIFSTSFCAVPLFIRVLPVTNSGPVITSTGKSAAAADFPVEVITGPEIITGSTRMKSGTAQKLVLNMISTTVMIELGRVEDNRMVNMMLANDKLVDRGTRMLMQQSGMQDYEEAKALLLQYGSVKKAASQLK